MVNQPLLIQQTKMRKPLQRVMIAGEERELLYTLSLYKILQERKQQVVIAKNATYSDITMAMLKMIYAAYLNAIEVRQIDDEGYNPERLSFMDMVVWSEIEPKQFGEQVKLCYYFITGKELELDVKKKTTNKEKETPVQKISIWKWIGAKFKTSSSEK